MTATIIPFRRKQKAVPVDAVRLYNLTHPVTGEEVLAVDEAGAARQLLLSLAQFRALAPIDPVPDSDGTYYSVDSVVAAMRARGIPVGTIERGRR